jgi:tetratricopeptide (TPR) repeat protein
VGNQEVGRVLQKAAKLISSKE